MRHQVSDWAKTSSVQLQNQCVIFWVERIYVIFSFFLTFYAVPELFAMRVYLLGPEIIISILKKNNAGYRN